MVLHRGTDTELLPLRTIRPELAVPMVEPSSTGLADSDIDHCVLHRHMDCIALDLLLHVEESLLGSASLRYGTRRPSLGPDSLEYLRHGSLSTLDGGTDRERAGSAGAMAMAGSARCIAGCWQVFSVFMYHRHFPIYRTLSPISPS